MVTLRPAGSRSQLLGACAGGGWQTRDTFGGVCSATVQRAEGGWPDEVEGEGEASTPGNGKEA